MTITLAKALFFEVFPLKGHYSQFFKTHISEVFIGFKDPLQCRFKYEALKNGVGYPPHSSDTFQHTICAALENGKIVSVKEVIYYDKLEHYSMVYDKLERMNWFPKEGQY